MWGEMKSKDSVPQNHKIKKPHKPHLDLLVSSVFFVSLDGVRTSHQSPHTRKLESDVCVL